MPPPVCLIVNPSAAGGRGERKIPEVEAALRALGVDFRTQRTTSMAHAGELAAEAAQRGEIAAAMGGDGIIGAVAAALRDTDGTLGVVPGGRGNDLARVLGISSEPAKSCAVLAGGVTRRIDLGEAGGAYFIGIASAGFDSDANRIANEATVVRGNLVYAYAALRALAAFKPARFTVTVDGERHEFTGYSVAAANSKAYGGGMYLAPDAELDDGLLDVVVTEWVPKRRFVSQLPKVFKGDHVDNPEVHVFRAREVTFEADRPFALYADGDPIADLPTTVRVLPQAVSVLVPASP
jgi:YegS/Rv2252/BmrU family lipid kinase